MTDKELRRMNRSELLELLIKQMEENIALKEKLESAETELQNRKLTVTNAGSLAEAALQLNGIFEAAEAAAAQYLENVRKSSVETSGFVKSRSRSNTSAAALQKKAQQASENLLRQTEEDCRNLRAATTEECLRMVSSAQQESTDLLAKAQQESEEILQKAQQDGEQILARFKEESRRLYEKAVVFLRTSSQQANKQVEKEHKQ